MNTFKDYDVLRLIEHNRICYVSSDNVKGWSLARWIKYHPFLPKDQLLEWIYDILQQLGKIHKCRGNPYYEYVNPYSIIISVEGKISFLDVGADSNKERVRMMLKRNVKENFWPDMIRNIPFNGEELDIYGAGKTIQYLLAFTEAEPEFTRKEKKQLRKLILRCINRNDKKAFCTMSEIQTYVSKFKVT